MTPCLSDDGLRHELIDGHFVVTPAPGSKHQTMSMRLATLLDQTVLGTHLQVLPAPFEVALGPLCRRRHKFHLIRGSFRYASLTYWDELARDLKSIYTAPTAAAAAAVPDRLEDTWGRRYPAMIQLWRNAWEEFIPFLDYHVEIRRVICSISAIESLNAGYRL